MRKGRRAVHIDGKAWEWKVGKESILIWSPEGEKHVTDQSQVTGMSWDSLERGYWKGWFKGITPSMVKEWIVHNIINTGGGKEK